MSASEKLKAVEASGDPWLAYNALPHIIAVVEAAEQAQLSYRGSDYDEAIALDSALAALEEALS